MLTTRFLDGRRALITGGASGIGRACAVRLAEAGASVVVVDRDAEGAKRVAEAVDGQAVTADLSDLDAVDALDLDVDVVVNNAGLQHVAPIHEFPPTGSPTSCGSCWRRRSGWPGARCRTCTPGGG